MAASGQSHWIFISILLGFLCSYAAAQCENPVHFMGSYFSIEDGKDRNTVIDTRNLKNEEFEGECDQREDVNSSISASGKHDSKILYNNRVAGCYRCFILYHRTPNVVQYKYSGCRSATSGGAPLLEDVCEEIPASGQNYTFFSTTYEVVNCKNTLEGAYSFSYEWDVGGGGPCDSAQSQIIACQEPGSVLKDNTIFYMTFGKCDDISTSKNENIEFRCMGTWEDENSNIWSGVTDISKEMYRERFRCMLTRYDQEVELNQRRWTMSWYAECGVLSSPYDGPVRLMLTPIVGGHHLDLGEPQCNYPTNYTGVWYHTGEYDVDVSINDTHMYMKTTIDQYWYDEAYFVCMMTSGTRYLTMAITVGKCELDYVCYDMLPRHHSIIRWRMSKPYRLTETELALPNSMDYMFRQACTWSSFTIDRDNFHWNYRTFLLNPPIPIECPIRGRYSFVQRGPESEHITTRIEGITERPRHQIPCTHYVSEFKSCDENPTKIDLDAEYCETVDFTGRPIGEYDIPDWELTCVGHWDEDWQSYLITWDEEDATSSFRCWNYERTDWRFVQMSRSTSAACPPGQTSLSYEPEEGASLNLLLTENERQYDDCAQAYIDGDPWSSPANIYTYQVDDHAITSTTTSGPLLVMCLLLCALVYRHAVAMTI